jgi:hypothetical protein
MQNDLEISQKICEGCHHKAGPRCFFSKAANPCFRTFLALYYLCFILELLALKMNGAMAVPDPEPRLLDTNAAEPTKLQLLFHPFGKYAASTHFIHVRVPFNFSQLLETPTKIFEQYQNYMIEVDLMISTTYWFPCQNTKSLLEISIFSTSSLSACQLLQ